jgi:hypothetical protein
VNRRQCPLYACFWRGPRAHPFISASQRFSLSAFAFWDHPPLASISVPVRSDPIHEGGEIVLSSD